MATSMKIVSNKAIASAAVSSRRTGLAKRSGAISARPNVSGLRKLNKVGGGCGAVVHTREEESRI